MSSSLKEESKIINLAKNLLNQPGSALVYQWWECSNCGHAMDIEQEVGCWQCGNGEMLFKEGTPSHLIVGLLSRLGMFKARVNELVKKLAEAERLNEECEKGK